MSRVISSSNTPRQRATKTSAHAKRAHTEALSKKPLAVRIASFLAKLIPGDYLKTKFYFTLIAKPREILRQFISSFYRIDHIYEVLRFARDNFEGRFSILEFGSANGYAFTKMLYATKYLGMADRVTCHAFDTFEGMPQAEDAKDEDQISGDGWVEGQFAGQYEQLDDYCRGRYSNYRLHKGFFEESLTPEFLTTLTTHKPVLVWIDCDYYSSTRAVFERLLPYIPNGCVIYFDDYELLNFGSRFTGEARFVHEVNSGLFGDDLELVLDKKMSLDTSRCYRFMRFESRVQYQRKSAGLSGDHIRLRTNDSPLP